MVVVAVVDDRIACAVNLVVDIMFVVVVRDGVDVVSVVPDVANSFNRFKYYH